MAEMKKVEPMVGYAVVTGAGYLQIGGEDRTGFLQRQTTNDISRLKEKTSILSVLTSPTARILDVLWVLLEDNQEQLVVMPLPGRGEKTAQFLKSRIFFMDKVTVVDASQQYASIDLYGKNAVLAALSKEKSLPAAGEMISVHLADIPGRLIAYPLARIEKWRLVIGRTDLQDACAYLEAHGLHEIKEAEVETWRIEAGLPGATNELTEEHTPLEVGLLEAIADGKGCYTGQEVIARQITYDKVTRRLVGLKMEATAPAGSEVWAGESGEVKPAGKVTSSVNSGLYGAISLAVIRRPYFEPGTKVSIRNGEEMVPATVCELPFG